MFVKGGGGIKLKTEICLTAEKEFHLRLKNNKREGIMTFKDFGRFYRKIKTFKDIVL